jgi:putative oxidoreductase
MLHFQKVNEFRTKYNDIAYMAFRVLVGLFFIAHGMQKIFGVFTDKGAQPILGGNMSAAGVNLMWIAGLIEFLGGLLIIVGLFTSIAALLSAITMLCAYFIAHAPRGTLPIANGGELALLYFAAFVYIIFEGGGKYSLDAKLWKN